MKLFVWDFHGVLEKGNELATVEITNRALEHFGYSCRLDQKCCQTLYGRKWRDYFVHLLPDEHPDRYDELQNWSFRYSDSHPEVIARYISPNDYAHTTLQTISEAHDQILISNTQPTGLKIFLEAVQMTKFFPDNKSYAADSEGISQNTKAQYLTKYLKEKNYQDIVIIGDSASDMELHRVAGGKRYLYAHPNHAFREAEADFKIQDLREILREI